MLKDFYLLTESSAFLRYGVHASAFRALHGLRVLLCAAVPVKVPAAAALYLERCVGHRSVHEIYLLPVNLWDVKKDEMMHLHRLVNMAAEEILEEETGELEDVFPVYEEMDVSPVDWSQTNKTDQKKALKTLTGGLADLIEEGDTEEFWKDLPARADLEDEELVRKVGKVYRDQGFSRPEAAQLISEHTDFTYRTVYDKFTDNGINFTFHGEEKRREAVEKLEKYAEEGYRKTDALQDVSDELEVPEGTLKNWLTEEGVTFTETVSALVSEDSQEELIHTAEHYFDFSSPEGVEAMEKALDRKRDTLRAYRQGKIDTMPVELLERLDALFESEPVYGMEDPENYVLDSTEKTVEVEDGFQEYLFSHLDGNEFEGITGKSSTTFNRYRNNKSDRIDREAYRKVFQAVSFMYERHPEPEIEGFVDRNSYATSSGDREHARLDPEEITEDVPIEI